MSKKFKHLNLSPHWQQYFSKYPQGYTIIENLIDWVSQVDGLVDNVNGWNEYLNMFVEKFDIRLQKETADKLVEFLEDGTLAQVINNDVFDMKSQVIVAKTEPENVGQNTYWYKDVGESVIEESLKPKSYTNVTLSEDEPEDEKFNVWFDY